MSEEERFGTRLAEALGSGPPESARAAQRAALLLRYHRARQEKSLWKFPHFAAVGATLAALTVVVLVAFPFQRAVSARVHGESVVVGQAVTSATEPSELVFSDGSRVAMDPHSGVKLDELTDTGARIVLVDGALNAAIEHRARTSWTVSAGPYHVHVVGTVFRVLWNAHAQRLVVQVSHGEVRVSGGDIPSGGVSVKQGEQLERGRSAPTPPSVAAPRQELPVAEPPSAAPATSPSALEPKARASAETWQSLASRGMYAAALSAAEKEGMKDLLARESAADLLLLGNSARFASRGEPARRAYLTLRERFPGTASASLSAYYMARLASELDKSNAEAVRWLRVFLAESPRGDLAASARARLMDLLDKQGDPSARQVAQEYLELHPGGPHTELARSVLARKSR
jgi:hypothetical protein